MLVTSTSAIVQPQLMCLGMAESEYSFGVNFIAQSSDLLVGHTVEHGRQLSSGYFITHGASGEPEQFSSVGNAQNVAQR